MLLSPAEVRQLVAVVQRLLAEDVHGVSHEVRVHLVLDNVVIAICTYM